MACSISTPVAGDTVHSSFTARGTGGATSATMEKGINILEGQPVSAPPNWAFSFSGVPVGAGWTLNAFEQGTTPCDSQSPITVIA